MGQEKKKHKRHKADHNDVEEKKKHKHKRKREDKEESQIVPSHGDISLSVEETNKLREKLGLAPLASEESVTETKEGHKKYTINGDSFVHIVPANWGTKKESEKLAERLGVKRQKRELEQRLLKVKPLGLEHGMDDASSWVRKSRQLQKDKEIAAKKAKILEELDEEFGIDQLIETNMPTKHKANAEHGYTSQDLKGIKIDHSLDVIQEGETLIMTLADKDIMKEIEETEKFDGAEEVILQNVNLLDTERGLKNIETQSKKPEYKPYLEEEQYDEYGMFKPKGMLGKYDEELGDLPEKETFTIGEQGIIDASQLKREKEDHIKKMREGLNMETLETTPLEIAKEYFTHEELAAKFKKKPKSKGKLRRTRIAEEEPRYENAKDSNSTAIIQQVTNEEEMLELVELEEEKSRMELEEALQKVRRIKNVTNLRGELNAGQDMAVIKGPERVVEIIKNKLTVTEDEDLPPGVTSNGVKKNATLTSNNIVLNTTAEFCRTLRGFESTEKPSVSSIGSEKQIIENDAMHVDSSSNSNGSEDETDQMDLEQQGFKPKQHKDNKAATTTITQEPDIEKGLAQALELVKAKGYLDKPEQEAEMSVEYMELKCKRFMVEDKPFELDDHKYSQKRDRYSSGPIVDFKEKRDYVPDFKLDYVDDQGNMLNTKEAFRFMSHKFHGKGAGKKKVEKRAKKYYDRLQKSTKQANPTDMSPMNTVNLLLNKQKEIKAPYLILSGKSTSLSGPGI